MQMQIASWSVSRAEPGKSFCGGSAWRIPRKILTPTERRLSLHPKSVLTSWPLGRSGTFLSIFCVGVCERIGVVPWSVFRREDLSRCTKKGERPPDVCAEDRSPAFFVCAERRCRSPVQKGGTEPLPVAGAHGRRRLGLYVFLGKVWSFERQRGFGRLYSYLALPGVVLSGVTRYRLHAVL